MQEQENNISETEEDFSTEKIKPKKITVDEKSLLRTIREDKSNTDSTKIELDEKRKKWISEYNGDPYGNETEGKAEIISRDVKKTALWQHSSFIEPFVVDDEIVNCSPVTWEDETASVSGEIILNHYFCKKFKRYNFISDSFKIGQREGTAVAKVSWIYIEKEIEVEEPIVMRKNIANKEELSVAIQEFPEQSERIMQSMQQGQATYVNITVGSKIVTKTKIIENRPNAEVCRNESLWIDPTCGSNIDEAKFVIHKFKKNISELREDGRYKNLDKVKIKSSNEEEESPYEDTADGDDFKFSDKARIELDVYEYWGKLDIDESGIAKSVVCTYIDDVVIRLEENPYPDKDIPFVSFAIDSDPFSINGKANADLIGPDQRIKTGIKRALLDTLDSSSNGQKAIQQGTVDPINEEKWRNGEFFKYKTPDFKVWEGKFEQLPSDVMGFYGLVSSEIESLTGVKPAVSGGSSSVSATMAKGAFDATSRREADISRNFKENYLIPLLRKWFSMAKVMMSDEEIVRITNKEPQAIRREDINGDIDIGMNVSTVDSDIEKSRKISFGLQTTAQTLPLDITKILMAKQMELDNMPDVAKKIMQYEPQPDPLVQEKAQLEIEKLKAEIAERQSRAAENQVDMRLKNANADLAEARARDYHSTADKKDKEFLDDVDGKKYNDDLDKIYAKEDAKAINTNNNVSQI